MLSIFTPCNLTNESVQYIYLITCQHCLVNNLSLQLCDAILLIWLDYYQSNKQQFEYTYFLSKDIQLNRRLHPQLCHMHHILLNIDRKCPKFMSCLYWILWMTHSFKLYAANVSECQICNISCIRISLIFHHKCFIVLINKLNIDKCQIT